MIQLLLLALCTSLFIFGWNYATSYTPNESTPERPYGTTPPSIDNRQVAWWFRYYIGRSLFPYSKLRPLLKPLFACNVCMASVYGSISYWMTVPLTIYSLLMWPVFICMTAGLNRLLTQIAQI